MAERGYVPERVTDPKIGEYWGAAARGGAAFGVVGLGGGFEGDLVAEGLELAEVGAHLAAVADVGVVEVRAEVVVAGLGVGQQVPEDHQEGAADGDVGFVLAAAAGDPPVAFAEEGVGAGGADGGLAQDAGQVAVAVPGG